MTIYTAVDCVCDFNGLGILPWYQHLVERLKNRKAAYIGVRERGDIRAEKIKGEFERARIWEIRVEARYFGPRHELVGTHTICLEEIWKMGTFGA